MKKEAQRGKTGQAGAMGEDRLHRLLRSVPGYLRVTFASAMAAGLLTHLYMFTNKFLNKDDVGHLFGSDYGAASGRWLLPYALKLHGSLSMPWLIGVFSLIFISLSACLTVSVLRIRRPLSCALTAALMVSFPTVASTFAYMFSADAYFFALLLACFAAFVAVRFRWGWLLAAIPLTLSMGIYQSYFGVAAVLLTGALLQEVLDGGAPLSRLLLRALRFAAGLGLALVCYLAVSRLASPASGLVDYMGISSMGRLPLSKIPRLVWLSYKQCLTFFIDGSSAARRGAAVLFFALAALAAVYLLVGILRRQRARAAAVPPVLLLVLLYPLAGNLITLMTPDAKPHLLMLYGLLYLPLLPLTLAEYAAAMPRAEGKREGRAARLCLELAGWVSAAAVALSVYSGAVSSNEAYFKMQLSYNQVSSLSTRLIGAVERAEGYNAELPVVLVGMSRARGPQSRELDAVSMTGVFDLNGLLNSYTYPLYLRRFLAFPNPVSTYTSKQAKEMEAQEKVKNMPVYPDPGSVSVIEGTVVVKMGAFE